MWGLQYQPTKNPFNKPWISKAPYYFMLFLGGGWVALGEVPLDSHVFLFHPIEPTGSPWLEAA